MLREGLWIRRVLIRSQEGQLRKSLQALGIAVLVLGAARGGLFFWQSLGNHEIAQPYSRFVGLSDAGAWPLPSGA